MSALLLKDYYVIFRQMKIRMGKIPDCLDSIVNKNLRHLLGLILRQGQNGNLHLILPDKFRETANHLDLNPANGNPLQNRVYVKNPYQAEATFFEVSIIGKCLSQITCTQDNHGMNGVQSQYFTNFCIKIFYIISISLLSKTAEII